MHANSLVESSWSENMSEFDYVMKLAFDFKT